MEYISISELVERRRVILAKIEALKPEYIKAKEIVKKWIEKYTDTDGKFDVYGALMARADECVEYDAAYGIIHEYEQMLEKL